MHKICLALGSNLGDRLEALQSALEGLKPYVTITSVSSVYETDPAYVADQPAFLNGALAGETDLDPQTLLFTVKNIEQQIGRVPTFHYGPRRIDIDILFYDDLALESPALSIPHHLMQERLFVMRPLNDVAPHWVHPVLKRPVHDLLADVAQDGGVCLTDYTLKLAQS